MSDTARFIEFVRDKYRTSEQIMLHEPRFSGNEKKYVLDAIESTYVSSVGPYVDKFEAMMASISQTKRAVAVVNGTSALQVSLRLTGVQSGDEVITQALTFVATANAIAYNNARPVFLDVDLDTMGLSPTAVSEFLQEFGELRDNGCYNKKTGNRISACVPMHTFGFPTHLHELVAICSAWKIPIIEDAAESIGSTYYGRPTGSFGQFGVYSFNGNKIVTAGGGGAIVTQNAEMGARAKYITNTAKKPHKYEYIHDEIGYNFRMPNLNAALICAQIEQLETFIHKKRALAEAYSEFFTSLNFKFRTETPNTKANYWLMCIECNDRAERDSFLIETNDNAVMTRPIWELMYRLNMYSHCYRDSQKNAEFLVDRIVNIPSSVPLNE